MNGTVAAAYEYDPYGNLLRADGVYAAQNAFRFSTKFQDSETGLIYYGHRYYSPRDGRFINRDPIQEQGGLNLYGFCGNDGINHWDYLGYSWLSKLLKKSRKLLHKIFRALMPIRALRAMDRRFERWVEGHMREIKIAAAIIASIVTYGAASGWAMTAMTATQATATAAATYSIAGTAISATTAGVVAGAVGGAAAGFVGSAIMTGDIKQALRGAAAGAIMGGVAGYYGKAWSLERVAATTVGGGVASEVSGGSFRQGAIISGAIALVTYGAMKMREFTVNQSRLDSRNASGESAGFNGDDFKAGGGRFDERPNVLAQTESPLGGIQGGQGVIKLPLIGRIEYARGSFLDRVVEAYSGVHDWLNNPWGYNPATGNYNPELSLFGRHLEAIGINASKAASFMNWVDVPLATPIVAASVVQIYVPNYVSVYNQRGGN